MSRGDDVCVGIVGESDLYLGKDLRSGLSPSLLQSHVRGSVTAKQAYDSVGATTDLNGSCDPCFTAYPLQAWPRRVQEEAKVVGNARGR